jgi:hypothetical protein
MSSIAKANISLSKKDLSKSRIPPVASRNVVFYHKATAGQLTINLLSLTMPTVDMPTAVQATNPEISGAQLMVNKKNLDLTSSSNGKLIQGLDYVVVDSYTISLIGPYIGVGAEVDEIFVGTINSAPISDLVVASAKSVDKTYTLAVGSTVLNLGREYKVGSNPFESIGSIKVFVNGVLALRGSDYIEVDSGNGYGTTIQFFTAPVSIPHQVAVDFGVMAITDNNAIGAIENLGGAIKKIADDLAVVAGTSATDYYNASPSEVERRTFGDTILSLNSKFDTTQNLSAYTKTRWQQKTLATNIGTFGVITNLSFSNLTIGKVYRYSYNISYRNSNTANSYGYSSINHNGSVIDIVRSFNAVPTIGDTVSNSGSVIFTAAATTVLFNFDSASGKEVGATSRAILEELPNHEITTAWT